jgi:drug/metabolite transporter (DMT)-like permease
MSREQWGLLVALSVLWGGSFFFVGVAVRELPAFTIVLVRVGLAALFLFPFVIVMRLEFPRRLSAWVPFLGMSLLNNVIPFTLFTVGQKSVTSGLASVLNAATPLFAIVVARLFADEELRANKLAGVLLGIAGVAVLVGPEALSPDAASSLGMLLCLGGALSYGFAALWGRRLRQTSPLVTACCQLMCSTLVLAILAGLIDQPWTLSRPGLATLLALVGLAALSTSLAYVIFFRILTVSGPTNVMLVTLLIPVTGIGLGILVLGETIEPRQIAGALVIASGLALIDGRVLGLLPRLKRAL